jgi:adenosylcobinamide-GDP ribazoletransferase
MKEQLRSFGAAVQFLTVVPIRTTYEPFEIGRSAAWFPGVGLAIGLVAAAVDWLIVEGVFPPAVAAALGVTLLAAASGGFHLDGLADTADGFLSSRPRERVLEIMRDSRIGTMGVLAIVFALGLKFAALASLLPYERVLALIVAPVAGRCMLVVAMASQPYARPEGGLASLFLEHRRVWHAPVAIGILLIVGVATAGCAGIVLALVPMAAVLLLNLYCRCRIGGITGDTVGAACEIAETSVLVAASALM